VLLHVYACVAGIFHVWCGIWQIVFGNCGVLQGISQGKSFVNMSTIDVETAHDVCEVSFRLYGTDIKCLFFVLPGEPAIVIVCIVHLCVAHEYLRN